CYAASIGGIATLIGTPPNAILAGVIEKTYGYQLGFLEWMSFGLPLSIVALIFAWFYLTRFFFADDAGHLPGSHDIINEQITRLGPMSREEKYVGAVLAGVAVLWLLRGLVDHEALRLVKDSTIAIAGALLLFLIPVNLRRREFLLDWKTAVSIPWDIIILFGGGFALAQGFSETGLTSWLAGRLSILAGINIVLIVAAVVLLVVFLTEITSNTATASILLPVMGALAAAIEVHPFGLMAAAVIAASFAFMLPVATPPNAIVFSSRYITIPQMIRAGFWLNLASVVLITGFVYFVLPAVWGLDLVTVSR
ncbi:MAG: SLC13 family permease, partial [Gammaproteobacteria bacterium]|nr:SLC13 family permease [Gammaproteobacteria bacterium]